MNQLAEQKDQLIQWMRSQPEYVGVNSDLKMNKPQVNVDILRDRASEMGISVTQISRSMQFLMGEPDISEIEQGNERYEVISEISQKGRSVPSVLNQLYVRSDDGELISMANVVSLEESVGPSEVHHFNRQRSVTISTSTPPDVVMGDAINKLEQRISGTLPAGFQWELTGEAEDMQESFFFLTISLVFSIVFVYLVLAAQFESWLHPFTILFTLPLAAVGAYGMLYALGMTFSVFTFIGTIMLVGLVTKNGILLVDYTNVLEARGYDVMEAAQEAGEVRFRPVLMTAISTILGMMPIALGYGAGGESRAPMGWSVAGGMFTATGLTLVVIPVVYTTIDDLTEWARNEPGSLTRILLGGVMVGVGAWFGWWPISMGWSGLLFAGSLISALIFITLGYGLLRSRSWSYYLGMVLGGLALIGGLLFWFSLPMVVNFIPPGIDPISTGMLTFSGSLVALVILNLPVVRHNLFSEESR